MDLQILAPDGVEEVLTGADLVALIGSHLPDLREGDIVLITSKILSKSEGRVVDGERTDHVAAETSQIVAQRGQTVIARTRLGIVQAAAGVDSSNLEVGKSILLPLDPDASARSIREALLPNVAVVITDTAGRAWRTGQTDIAIGVAGIDVLDDHTGRTDSYGNTLAVTAPAIADELAGAADLVKTKLGARPLAVVRGLAERVLPRGEHGPGAVALQRPIDQDMFALGAREAVLAAVAGLHPECFGSPVDLDDLVQVLGRLGVVVLTEGGVVTATLAPDSNTPVSVVAQALGWLATPVDAGWALTPRG